MIPTRHLLLPLAAATLLAACSAGAGDACRSDDECASDLYCAGPNDPNVCGIPPREGCATDADCFGGAVCHVVGDVCSPDGMGSECGPPCDASNCGSGLRCNAAGACEPLPCDEGFACPSHQRCDVATAHAGGPVHGRTQGCVNISCANDTDCPTAKACVNGSCHDGPGTCREVSIVP
ncbi:Dickkopf N-terminal cysteine-rich domain-containing protein [Polyangium aurulentum]|uniref:Dickkopf N-terminal cysteine-rich domain-containing protein n=1 Tax=Polyangium aurulentum TaxID=2567896 RepID=UPI0010AE2D6B|nr:Dickkopf N-terminal cysteine-rich domain-containing protein [Polyangium aurulentum]UQA54736.1 hypothetical protein E8A73_025530 [Polyangium aurulentum]